jgi:hypothetical protein
MRMLDAERQQSVRNLQLYLRPTEARKLREALEVLLRDPEANEHRHIIDDGWDLSFSLFTDTKLRDTSGIFVRRPDRAAGSRAGHRHPGTAAPSTGSSGPGISFSRRLLTPGCRSLQTQATSVMVLPLLRYLYLHVRSEHHGSSSLRDANPSLSWN